MMKAICKRKPAVGEQVGFLRSYCDNALHTGFDDPCIVAIITRIRLSGVIMGTIVRYGEHVCNAGRIMRGAEITVPWPSLWWRRYVDIPE